MNGLGTEGKWYEFNFDYKNIDRHLVMGGIQTASSAAGSLVNDPATSKALNTFVQGSLMTLYDYSRGEGVRQRVAGKRRPVRTTGGEDRCTRRGEEIRVHFKPSISSTDKPVIEDIFSTGIFSFKSAFAV